MSNFDFNIPTRQSAKGILVIFGINLFKFAKNGLVVFIPVILKFFNSGSVYGLSLLQLILIIFGLLIVILMISILNFLNFKFHISNEGFHLQKGIINKENIIIPQAKIQNVYTKQNVLQQMINVSSLAIETASEGKAEVEIVALPSSVALELQKTLLSNKTSVVWEKPTNVYYKISIKKLFIEGITNNHFKSLLIIFTFFSGLYYENKSFIDEYSNNVQPDRQFIENLAIINLLFISVAVLLVVIFFSIAKTILLNFDLTVTEQSNSLNISKGLLNKIHLNLLPSRIQSLTIRTNILKKIFQLHTLDIKQAMTSKKQKENLSIIGLNTTQIEHLINQLYIGFEKPETRQKPELYYRRVKIIRSICLLVILNILIIALNDVSFYLINLIAIPFSYLYVKYTYKKAFYSVNEHYVIIENGFIDSVTRILELHKIQSVSFLQTSFQKRQHIASLQLATASGNFQIKHIKEEHAKTLMDYLLYNVEFSHRNWM